MRGKGKLQRVAWSTVGITPAYAGKRYALCVQLFTQKDHPRLCGEKDDKQLRVPSMTGSPPPMRGKAACVATLLICKRITPAYAGKSNFRLFL